MQELCAVRVWVLSKGIRLDMDVCLYVHVRAGKGTCGPSYAHVSVTVWRAAALWGGRREDFSGSSWPLGSFGSSSPKPSTNLR